MDFHYEVLDEKRFQKLSQALIVAQFPNAQCFPVGQSDGGRDAITESDPNALIVFQVKFSKSPSSKTEREAIDAVIKSEKEKVENLILRGATQYIFVTNVEGTAHLDVGSIDKVNETLTNAFGIPSQVWWRNDLDRRLENSIDIKWCYPEILKATDLLPLLIPSHSNTEKLQVTRALKCYMALQCEKDRDIKFKQVHLKHKLTDLFVDLPLDLKRPQTERNHRHRINNGELSDFDEKFNLDHAFPFDHSGLAGAFLLQMPFEKGVSRFVVEGAPGQGKSTVTQFLCQVNRLRLLKKNHELATIDDSHKTGIARTPFRLDMHDYAAWVSDRDPFTNIVEPVARTNGMRSLESFLVKQVEVLSGGLKISVNELYQFFAESHSIIVLDGFDEVADIETRRRIVKEICEAAIRLDIQAKSMQIIVTSRPAAFANSPGFPEDDWIHLELTDLQEENIEAYKDKWIVVQEIDEEESNQISSILKDKLEQPHLRDLARNPMQLSILLHLIHVQGVALPEKRTMLYEEYIKLFFHREAEKSKVVRERRELLLSIHGMLAWILHTQVEDSSGSGSITKAALLDEVKTYLETEEHDPQLAEELFQGTVERVGVLVSRQEGMFEFEVQPLREYFAARYLYTTAPYSPSGYNRKGTKPDRFEALARSFYWTNVTRFFCGFYDKGELDSLVNGITSLAEEDGYNLIKQPRHLAMMLLSDQVFTQAPKAMKQLVAFVTKEPGFQRYTCTQIPYRRRNIKLLAEVGGDALFEACNEKLREEDNSSRRRILREVMAQNADYEKLKSIWTSRCNNELTTYNLLCEAIEFGIVNFFTPKEIAKVAQKDVDCHLRWLVLADHYEVVAEDLTLRLAAKKAFFEGELYFPRRWFFSENSVTTFEALTELLQPYAFAKLFTNSKNNAAIYTIHDDDFFAEKSDFLGQIKQSCERSVIDSLDSFRNFVFDLLRKNVDEWQKSLKPWTALVDRGLDETPSNYIVLQIAVIATASKANVDAGSWDENGFTATKGLVNRLFFARHKCGDSDWWHLVLSDIKSESVFLYLTVLLFWGQPDTITSLKARISPLVENLPSRDWSRLWNMVHLTSRATRESRPTIPENWFQTSGTLSPRIALILLERVDNQTVALRLSRTYFLNYAGDDIEVLTYAAQIELKGSDKESINWNHIKHLSKRAQNLGIHRLFPLSGLSRFKIPVAVARDVLSNYELHNEQLVASCEKAYAAIVAQKASKVSNLAKADGWFTPSN